MLQKTENFQVVNATRVKNEFGEISNQARRHPVIVERSGKKSLAIMAYEDFEMLLQLLEDAEWGKKAMEAKKEGFIGLEESQKLLDSLLNAKD